MVQMRALLMMAALSSSCDSAPGGITCGSIVHTAGIVVEGSQVYWSTGCGGEIWTASIPAQAAGKLAGHRVAALGGCPRDLVADDTGVYVAGGCMGVVFRLPLDGGEPVKLAQVDDCVHGITVDESFVYFTAGNVAKVPKGGGPMTELVPTRTGGGGCNQGIVVHGNQVYWASHCYYTLNTVGVDGASPRMLHGGSSGYGALAVVGNVLFFEGDKRILRVTLGATFDVQEVALSPERASGIASDGSVVVWSTSAAVFEAPATGGPARQIAVEDGRPLGGVALTPTTVFFNDACRPAWVGR